jgi:hypothetical protein
MRKLSGVLIVLAVASSCTQSVPSRGPVASTKPDKAAAASGSQKAALDECLALLHKSKDMTPHDILTLTHNRAIERFGPPLTSLEDADSAGCIWGRYTSEDHNDVILVYGLGFDKQGKIVTWTRYQPSLVDEPAKREYIDEYSFADGKWVKIGHKPGEPERQEVQP